MIQAFQQTELCFQIPMPGHLAILVAEVGQHRYQPPVVSNTEIAPDFGDGLMDQAAG
jgi:hypothetical protein